MSTVKITELSSKSLTTNISNTIFVGVDLPTGTTGKYTAKNIADNLYANNALNVGSDFTLLNNPITFADGTTQNTSFAVTGTYANAAFLKANSAYDSQNTTGSYANSAFSAANTADSKAISAGSYANSAFSAANTADSKAISAGSYANSAFNVANSAAIYANGAFAKANTALANSTGTFAGDLTVAGNTIFIGSVHPEKGFIYTPRILHGAQTAITIDFANDSMIRATYSSTLTISFSNYTYGKVVEVWLTNTAGTGQTINLGVLANNSTTGSATLSVASDRSAKLQYFSIDGDLANTFCAITYA